ncbi:MAG: hypothetical protein PHV68_09560, partial [Candidatus Gastranaerophilales bacterium]|nr:hypothetical protein [Candidatus Gastranaerophilales bacterium]
GNKFRLYTINDSSIADIDSARELANKYSNLNASCCGDDLLTDNFFNETLACVKGELCASDIDFGADEEYGTTDDSCGCENEGSACLFSKNYIQAQGACSSNSCQIAGFFEASELALSKIEYSSLYSNSISEIKIYMKNIGMGPAAISKATINGLNVTSINYDSLVFPNQEQIIAFKAFMPCSPKGAINVFNFTIEYNDVGQRIFESNEYEIISDNPLSFESLSGHQETGYINLKTNDFESINYFIKNNAEPSIEVTAQNSQSESIFSRTITYKGEYQGPGINNENFTIPQNSAMAFLTRIYPTISGQSGSYLMTFQDKNCEYNKITISYGYDTSSQTSGAISVMVADEKISIISIIMLLLILDKFLIKKNTNNS